jgi:phosphate/sulfate permease
MTWMRAILILTCSGVSFSHGTDDGQKSTGLPVSTTHIVASGIAGTMVTSGAGLQYGMLSRILMAWVLTLPVTILIAGALYYLLASPKF